MIFHALSIGEEEKGEKVRTETSPYGQEALTVYKSPGNATTDFAVTVWIKDEKEERRIFYQNHAEDVYILWKNKNIVYINGEKLHLSEKKEIILDGTGKSFYGTKKENGITALMKSAYNRKQNEFQALIRENVNVNAKNTEGLNAIDFTVRGNSREDMGIYMIKKLRSKGCRLSEQSMQVVMKPFLYQMEEGQCNYAIRQYMFQQARREGVKIPKLSQQDQLFQDIADGKYRGAIPVKDIRDKDGNTLTAVAAGYGNIKMLERLYKNNLAEIQNIYGQDTLLYSIDKRKKESVKYLLEKGNTSSDALNVAAGTGDVEMVKLILSYCDLKDDWHLNKAIKEAIYIQANNVVKYLTSKMQNVDYHASDVDTVLEEAKRQKNEEAVEIILNESQKNF